jgi:uncharacterized protein YegL
MVAPPGVPMVMNVQRKLLARNGVLGLVALVAIVAGALVLAPPAAADHQICKLDVGLVLDVSGSMAGTKMTITKSGSRAFIGTLSAALDYSGLVSFDNIAYLNKALSADHVATDLAIAALAAGGGTNIGQGITASHNDFKANARWGDARQVMIVLSDGVSTDSPVPPAELAKLDGIEIFSIAVGSGADEVTMRSLASDPKDDHYYFAATAADITTAFEGIAAYIHKLCAVFDYDTACEGMPATFYDLSRFLPPVTLVRSKWDWGDGNTDTYSPWVATPTHTYAAGGSYMVTLEVWDSEGGYDITTQEVIVDYCPVALFLCEALGHPWYLYIQFFDDSYDIDGTIVRWEWTFESMGTSTEQHPRVGPFPAKGWYDVTLQVWDNDNYTDSITLPCFADLNRPPIIDPIPVQVVYEGQDVRFMVNGRDPDGDPTIFKWAKGGLPPTALAKFKDGTNIPDKNEFLWRTGKGHAGTYTGLHFEIWDFEFMDETDVTIIVLPVPPPPPPSDPDADGDGVPDSKDNCPFISNPTQEDSDGDGVGNLCQGMVFADKRDLDAIRDDEETDTTIRAEAEAIDSDGDGWPDTMDNCPHVPNFLQHDLDRDGVGDLCDDDIDNDGIPQLRADGTVGDNCPYTFNPLQIDSNGDGIGDACEGDVDADGVPDELDNCMWVWNPGQQDRDGDGVGDECQGLVGKGASLRFEPATPNSTPVAEDAPPPTTKASTPPVVAIGAAMGAAVLVLAVLVLVLQRRRD